MDKAILTKTMGVIKILIKIHTEMRREILMKELIKTHIRILMEIPMGIHMVGKDTKSTEILITKLMKGNARDIKKERKCFDSITKLNRKWLKKNLTTLKQEFEEPSYLELSPQYFSCFTDLRLVLQVFTTEIQMNLFNTVESHQGTHTTTMTQHSTPPYLRPTNTGTKDMITEITAEFHQNIHQFVNSFIIFYNMFFIYQNTINCHDIFMQGGENHLRTLSRYESTYASN